jgi:hypothetical protein
MPDDSDLVAVHPAAQLCEGGFQVIEVIQHIADVRWTAAPVERRLGVVRLRRPSAVESRCVGWMTTNPCAAQKSTKGP